MAWMGATLGGLLALKCPSCGLLQVRGRKPRNEWFVCRRCHRLFDRKQGTPPELAGTIGADGGEDDD